MLRAILVGMLIPCVALADEVVLGPPGSGGLVGGSGTSGQVAYWNASGTITSEAAFAYNASTNTFTAENLSFTTGAYKLVQEEGSSLTARTTINFVDAAITASDVSSKTQVSLNDFSSSVHGLVGASGGGTTNFLRADGGWAAPPGGLTGSGTSGQVTYWNGTSTVTGEAAFAYNDSTNTLTADNISFTAGAYKLVQEEGSSLTARTTINFVDDAITASDVSSKTQVSLNNFSSSVHGLAPASGGGSTNFLRADGTWAAPAGSALGDFVGPASSTDNAIVRFDGTTGKLGQNSAVYIDDSGNLLINTTTALSSSYRISSTSDSGNGGGIFSTASTTNASTLYGRRSRGTHASPTIVSSGDVLAVLAGDAWDGDSFEAAGRIEIGIDATPGNGDVPGRIDLYTTPDGSATPALRMRVNNGGNIMMGTDTALSTAYRLSTVNAADGTGNAGGIYQTNSAANATTTVNRRSRGTPASPTVVSSGDLLYSLFGDGYDTNSYETGAVITFEVDGTPGDGDMPGRIVFKTTPDGSATAVEAMRLTNVGDLITSKGVSHGIASTSTDVTLTAAQWTELVDASGAARTITLPACASHTGRVYTIKKTDNSVNSVTIDGNASETIDGATTQALLTQWSSLTIQCNGTSWFIL